MASVDEFRAAMAKGYTFAGDSITLGAGMFSGEVQKDAAVRVPLRTLNRHGLIAGATGTGKTKTFQQISEALAAKGVPVLLMDIKGDLSGLCRAGTADTRVQQRQDAIGVPWSAEAFATEFLTISDEPGVRLRATVSEFGPVLFSKILQLNETQEGVVSLLFKYCDDRQFPLLDLKDFKKALQYLTNEGKAEVQKDYGLISTTSSGTILRKVIELEQQGADKFFGEPSFVVDDLLKVDGRGYGTVNILRLTDMQNRPGMFSTFMLCLLAEIYNTFPEEGDLAEPKLIIFIDEAHLVFREASKQLLEQLETVIKLIRSKGVGVFFCTQAPTDIPASILGQLGMKIQHALRAFTAQDRKAIKMVAENYPETQFYKTEELITSLGIGEALVTALDEKGNPTPLVHTMLAAPRSRMGPITPAELTEIVSRSSLARKYEKALDRDSAYEILSRKLQDASEGPSQPAPGRRVEEKSSLERIVTSPMTRQIGNTVVRELTRGILGALGLGGRRRR